MKTKNKPSKGGKETLREKIREAFEKAAAEEKRPFSLSGRGHEPRVTFDLRLAAVLRGVKLPRIRISGFGPNYYYPRRVARLAARLLRKRLGWAVVKMFDRDSRVYLGACPTPAKATE